MKAVEVVGEADALALRLGQQALAKLYVGSVTQVISASFVIRAEVLTKVLVQPDLSASVK